MQISPIEDANKKKIKDQIEVALVGLKKLQYKDQDDARAGLHLINHLCSANKLIDSKTTETFLPDVHDGCCGSMNIQYAEFYTTRGLAYIEIYAGTVDPVKYAHRYIHTDGEEENALDEAIDCLRKAQKYSFAVLKQQKAD